MYSIGIETAHKFLLLVLMDDTKVVDFVKMECLKKQSEYIIPEIDKLLSRNSLTVNDVSSIVVTVGPGSYTGVRIGLTVAKILGAVVGKKVYKLSSLQLYAGLNNCYSFIDARANRVYVGKYENGVATMDDTIYTLEEMKNVLDNENVEFIGDLHLFDKEDNYPQIENNFINLKDKWVLVDNIDTLAPEYLKSSEEYLKK